MKVRKLILSLTAVGAVAIFFGIFILMWFVADTYPDFEKFEQGFAIEGLDDGAVPQGITAFYATYDTTDENGAPKKDTQQYFLISAYMNDGSPSRIYVTGQKTGYVGYVTMLNEDGTPHAGHVGGIATNGARLWLSYGNKVLVAKASAEYKTENILREIVDKAAKNQANEGAEILTIQFTASFQANCNVAFLFYFDDSRYTGSTYDRLYVGEFYHAGNYETDSTHRFETPTGYKNAALMYEYNVDGSDSNNPYGLTRIDSTLKEPTITEENNVPKIQKIFSLPEMVQGIAFSGRTGYSTNDGVLVLSQSYGLANSHLLCFDWKTVNETKKKYTEAFGSSFTYKDVYLTSATGSKSSYNDSSLYIYYVDKGDEKMFVKDYSIPSMSEGMCVVTPQGASSMAMGRIYVLFESASKKYNLFTRESLKHVYSFIPNVK